MTTASNKPQPSETVWDPARYERTARFVSDLGESVVALLVPAKGERILDLGCGDGALTQKIAQGGAAVIGVDSSEPFIKAAKARGLEAQVMQAEALTFENEFDAVFSNAALHWVRDQDAMLAGVHRALKPGGRFVGEFGGAGNVAKVRAALLQVLRWYGINGAALDPWYFPTAEEYRARLMRHGFDVNGVQVFPRPTPLPGPLADWLGTFAQSFLAPLSESERKQAIDGVEEELADTLKGPDGKWSVDYVRLRFHAVKPA